MLTEYRRDTCQNAANSGEDYMKARIVLIFVVLVGSAVGAFLPLLAKHNPFFQVPLWCFFVVRYLGSGVIIATAFIHLLAEADESLGDPCLGGGWEEYPWSDGICLIGVFIMFFFDMVAHQKAHQRFKRLAAEQAEADEAAATGYEHATLLTLRHSEQPGKADNVEEVTDNVSERVDAETAESIYQQILNCLVLEFGIVFHSVFVGLSLAIAGNEEFISLFIAISFHQLLEGLGLGTRFATTPWPKHKAWVPWTLAAAYSVTTPTAIAIGLGVRRLYAPGLRQALIVTGIFDALCAGILIFNSLVELMAWDFMYSMEFKNDKNMGRILLGFFCLTIGALAMSIIGKWA